MRRFCTAALCALGMLTLTPAASAQIFGPTLNTAGSTLWFAPGRVALRGSNLGFVNRVTVDGVEVPILRNNGSRITIKPPPAAGPGFATVEVFDAQGSDTATLAYAPVVTSTRQGNRMDVALDNGAPGFYRLAYSFDLLSEPAHVPGIRYGLLLNLDSQASGILASGVLTTSRTVLEHMQIPREPGLIGQPVYLQFQGQQGFSVGHAQQAGTLDEDGILFRAPTRSFSNVNHVPSRPVMQPGG